ncbi:MAG: hypothetical protein ACOH2G_08615 [Ewingella sp.]
MREAEQETRLIVKSPKTLTSGECALSPQHDDLIEKLEDYAYTLGIDISRAALRRLVMGQIIDIEGKRYRAGRDGSLYVVRQPKKDTRNFLASSHTLRN